jgi:hypothetical protein
MVNQNTGRTVQFFDWLAVFLGSLAPIEFYPTLPGSTSGFVGNLFAEVVPLSDHANPRNNLETHR